MSQIDELEKAEMGKRRKDAGFGGVLTEELDGANAVGVKDVVDVMGEVVTDGGGRDGDARRPLFDQVFDVEKAVVAGGFEVFGELCRGEVFWAVESFGPHRPDSGDPGKVGTDAPLMGEIEPSARADFFFDGIAELESEEGRVTDEDGCVRLLQHGDGIGCGGKKCGMGIEEFAKEDLGVSERAARGGVGGDGFYGGESVRRFDDELDGTDFVE